LHQINGPYITKMVK